MQLHQPAPLDEIAALDARVVVVSFAPLSRLVRWVPHFREHFLVPSYEGLGMSPADPFARTRFVADPLLAAYHAYGLGRNSALRVYGPGILLQYARWALGGKSIKKPQEDPLQRGGDFVIGRDGHVTLAFVGRDQSERPAVTDLLAALRRGA
ncbi:MAG: hypothetical protein AVDCRST_MAG88-3259 [uncultured Thermomicrobiales bacterium]|uniref:Redoxin domain-containing protein n=1 Tax=uncultured Thermomicrobiales bacterium TaxID=1645740 RepID=A0A6J4VL80_9BACT|nr:MAG: hypothetical protein AVDCRST_MAG88-3259 [uncultured Thermomicrobiales bacterium]